MPSKKKTRRSISVRGLTYTRLANLCDRKGLSVSGVLEQLIAEVCEKHGEPPATELRGRRPRPSADEAAKVASAIFSF